MLHGTNLSFELIINNDMLKGLNNMEEMEKQIIILCLQFASSHTSDDFHDGRK